MYSVSYILVPIRCIWYGSPFYLSYLSIYIDPLHFSTRIDMYAYNGKKKKKSGVWLESCHALLFLWASTCSLFFRTSQKNKIFIFSIEDYRSSVLFLFMAGSSVSASPIAATAITVTNCEYTRLETERNRRDRQTEVSKSVLFMVLDGAGRGLIYTEHQLPVDNLELKGYRPRKLIR